MKKLILSIIILALSVASPVTSHSKEFDRGTRANRNAYIEQRLEHLNQVKCESGYFSHAVAKVKNRRGYLKIRLELTPKEDLYFLNNSKITLGDNVVFKPEVIVNQRDVYIINDVAEEGELPYTILRYVPLYWVLKKQPRNEKIVLEYSFRKPFVEDLTHVFGTEHLSNEENITFHTSYIPKNEVPDPLNANDGYDFFSKDGSDYVALDGVDSSSQKYLSFTINSRGSKIINICEE